MPGEDSKVRVVVEGDASSLAAEGARGKQTIQDLGAGAEKAAEQTKLFSGEGREMHRVISELNRVSPLLGEALRVALHPVGGTIAAAIGLFVEFKREIDATNKKLDELGAAAASPDFLAGIQSKLEILRSAAGAAEAYAQKLAEIKRGEHGVTEELKTQLELDKAIEQARASLASAQKGLDIARIQADEATHKITPEKAAEERAAAEKKFIAQQQADKEAAEDQELRRKMEALGKANAQQSDLEAKQRAAAQAQAEDEEKRAKDKADFGDDKKFKTDIDAASARTEKAALELQFAKQRLAGSALGTTENEDYKKQVADAQAELAASQGEQSRLQAGRSRFLGEQADTKTPADLKAAADLAAAQATANAKAFADLTEQIKELTAIIAATRPIDRQATDVKGQTVNEQERARLGKSVEDDVRVITEFEKSHNITPELISRAASAVQDLIQVLSGHRELLVELGRLGVTVGQIKQDQAILQQALAAMSNHTLSH
jgi:chromosome segregation ATPase